MDIGDKFTSVLKKVYPGADISGLKYHIPHRSSHEVYFLEFIVEGKPASVVLKLYPKEFLGYKDPDMTKEVAVLRGFTKAGTLKVPKVIYYDPADNTFGRRFFIMEKIDGIPMVELVKKKSVTEKRGYVRLCAELIAKAHNTPLANFEIKKDDFLEGQFKEFGALIDELEERENVEENKIRLMRRSVNYLRANAPKEFDWALLNGDFGMDHFIECLDGYCVIDWDPARMGDRSWDLYWMVKDIPESVFGYPEALYDLVTEYEKFSTVKLRNKKYFYACAIIYAYILGLYILEKVPEHTAVPAIKKHLAYFENKIEKIIDSGNLPAVEAKIS